MAEWPTICPPRNPGDVPGVTKIVTEGPDHSRDRASPPASLPGRPRVAPASPRTSDAAATPGRPPARRPPATRPRGSPRCRAGPRSSCPRRPPLAPAVRAWVHAAERRAGRPGPCRTPGPPVRLTTSAGHMEMQDLPRSGHERRPPLEHEKPSLPPRAGHHGRHVGTDAHRREERLHDRRLVNRSDGGRDEKPQAGRSVGDVVLDEQESITWKVVGRPDHGSEGPPSRSCSLLRNKPCSPAAHFRRVRRTTWPRGGGAVHGYSAHS